MEGYLLMLVSDRPSTCVRSIFDVHDQGVNVRKCVGEPRNLGLRQLCLRRSSSNCKRLHDKLVHFGRLHLLSDRDPIALLAASAYILHLG